MFRDELSIQEAELLLNTLSDFGDKGCGVISLALKTGIPQRRIRQFFKDYEDFCTPIKGRSVFKLNKIGPHKGSVEAMIFTLKERKRQEARIDYSGLGLFF